MFKKIFDFMTEYVIIEISGKNKERLLNMWLYKGIKVWDCVPLNDSIRLAMSSADFKAIRSSVRKSGARVHIIEKHGRSRFIKDNRKRIGFLVSGVAVVIIMTVLSQFIWCVELDGIKRADPAEVAEILRKNGVYVGARKSKINDLGEIKKDIIATDDINWAWLYMEGTKARLEIQEITPKPDVVDKTTPTDIIAIADGNLREATVRRGERRVNSGINVSKGQVLVSGKIPVFVEGEEERYSYVNSDGSFVADTIRKETGEFTKEEILTVPTGRIKTRFSFDIFGKSFTLSGGLDDLYEESETETQNFDLNLPFIGYTGISVKKHTVHEINRIKNSLANDEIIDRARENLEEKIMKGVGVGAVRTGEDITYTKLGDTYRITLTMYLRENIGIEIPRER